MLMPDFGVKQVHCYETGSPNRHDIPWAVKRQTNHSLTSSMGWVMADVSAGLQDRWTVWIGITVTYTLTYTPSLALFFPSLTHICSTSLLSQFPMMYWSLPLISLEAKYWGKKKAHIKERKSFLGGLWVSEVSQLMMDYYDHYHRIYW